MTTYNPMRELPARAGYREGDVLVLVGELFGRGYATGIIEEAKSRGMRIIGTTMGRRAADGKLRPLNAEELREAEALLGGKIINVPLEAGFDMEEDDEGRSPLEQLKRVKPDDWDRVYIDWKGVEQSRRNGARRFNDALALFAAELTKLLPKGANLLFVHAMAGGIPRARIFMPIMNRIFKGQGERFLTSALFWKSELGKLCRLSFEAVTADTFGHLVDATSGIRTAVEGAGGRVSYSAYGYHGCEVLIGGNYTWQSYNPYLPGWAKIRLEELAGEARSKGIPAAVFNSPEIQTNSSALFMGVEISLYPLLTALEKEGGGARSAAIREECRQLLADGCTIEKLLAETDGYLSNPAMSPFGEFATWPHHNSREQAELMLNCSARLLNMNKDPKEIVCAILSREVFTAVGKLMLDTMWEPSAPAFWLNHDIIAKRLIAG